MNNDDMIIEEKAYACPRCGSANPEKNGKNRYGNQNIICKDCRKSSVLNPKNSYFVGQKEQILAAERERPSTLASWICWVKRANLHFFFKNLPIKTMKERHY